MRRERQIELLERVRAAGPHLAGLHGEASMVNPSSSYTDPARFAREQQVLFRDGVVFVGLSCELREPGSYLTATFDRIPLLVVRQPDGSLRAMVNACRHRAAPLVPADSRGTGLRQLQCPYHNWTYDLEGVLRKRPMSEGAFDDVTLNCDLHRCAVLETNGLIFARPGRAEPIDPASVLSGAEDDLGSFGLDGYVHIDSRVNTWKMNWKLVLDTFTESYHIRTLHKDSIAPAFNSDCVIFEAFGRNLLSVGLRKDVFDEFEKPRDEWSLLPYGTIQYFLVPNGLVVHQLDHVEAWRVEPVDVHTTVTTTSIYAPEAPATDRALQYWLKNLDVLVKVTGSEDFPMMERIQANLESGAVPEVVYGRIEPPLVHFHRSIDEALTAAGT
jgi:phenylpropionate dioxygenase-like ring-hydroxylating dioxygenase large terminal subunit